MNKTIPLVVMLVALSACTTRVEIAAKEPITINLNLKIDHEIRVKVDKALDQVFTEDSSIF